MPRGGKRLGAGRKAGAANVRTREIADKAAEEGVTPLEIMLLTMRDLWAEGTVDGKANIAKRMQAVAIAEKAAPFVHARLAAIESKEDVSHIHYVIGSDPLTPEQWAEEYGTDGVESAGGPPESLN